MPVNYTAHYIGNKSGHRYRGEPCFGSCQWHRLKSIRYYGVIDERLTKPEMLYWVRCLKEWFKGDTLRYSLKLDYPTRRMTWTMSRVERRHRGRKTLLYLTAFRYPSYYWRIVKKMYECRHHAKTPSGRLRLMQQIHIDSLSRKGRYNDADIRMHYIGDHDLVCPRGCYGNSARKPISLNRFRKHLRSTAYRGVQAYFS